MSYYLSLHTSAPDQTGKTETDYHDYKRVKIPDGSDEWLTFPECHGGKSKITHCAICDAPIGGAITKSGTITPAILAYNGVTPKVQITKAGLR